MRSDEWITLREWQRQQPPNAARLLGVDMGITCKLDPTPEKPLTLADLPRRRTPARRPGRRG